MRAEFPHIQTGRLSLRQFLESDLENLFKGLSHPDVIKYYGVSYSTLEATKAQIKFFADLEKEETGIWWAVCSHNHKVFYGAVGFTGLNKTHKKAEIGFWLIHDFWGQGIMAEAITAICKYGFDELALHRIEAIVETENSNCKKTMIKLNFQHEGTMRECEIKNGKYISLEIYSKLKTTETNKQN